MGKPYADELRLVAVRLIKEGHTRPEVAELCGISLSSVGRYIRRYRATGSVDRTSSRLHGLCTGEVCRADQAIDLASNRT